MQILGIEWITMEASVFIVLILLVRKCFGAKIHPLAMKYLWGMAVLRIILPIRLFVPWIEGYPHSFSIPAWIVLVWLVGMMAMGIFLLMRNLRFWNSLRSNREIYGRKQGIRVYFVDKRIGSCLAGVWHPDIYISRLAQGSTDWCSWIVKHEISHYKALDHWFGVLRMLALAVQWFNPLVWYGALLSVEDLEIACDYRVTENADRAEQVEYGKCLVAMAAGRPFGILNNITAGTSLSTGSLKRRINRLGESTEKMNGGSIALSLTMAVVLLFMFCFPAPKSFATVKLFTGIPYVERFLVQYEQKDASQKEMDTELVAMRQRKKEIQTKGFFILQMDERTVGIILPFEAANSNYYWDSIRAYHEEMADFIALGEQFVLKSENFEIQLPTESERFFVETVSGGYELWYKLDEIEDAVPDNGAVSGNAFPSDNTELLSGGVPVVCIGDTELSAASEKTLFRDTICLAHESEFEKLYDWIERIQRANQSGMVRITARN